MDLYSQPSFVAIVFFVGIAVGALFNSLYRAAIIRKIKREFIQDALGELSQRDAKAPAVMAAPIEWNQATCEAAKTAADSSQQVDSKMSYSSSLGRRTAS
jgi:hypothetical protein